MESTPIWQNAANNVRLHTELEVASFRHYEQFMQALQQYVNNLLNDDFSKLVRILYRMDISEAKLRYLLAENKEEDAAAIIAELMMEREMKKVETRQKYAPREDSEEEKW